MPFSVGTAEVQAACEDCKIAAVEDDSQHREVEDIEMGWEDDTQRDYAGREDHEEKVEKSWRYRAGFMLEVIRVN